MNGARGGGRGALLASVLLLALVALFCAATQWGRMYPEFLTNSARAWTEGRRVTAADRRLHFYDETYPVLLYLRQFTPEDAVVLLPPERFIKGRVAARRPAGEDLIPQLGSASSAYAVLYPRVPVHDGSEAPLRDAVDWLLVWDWWGLDQVDPAAARTEENRVKLLSVWPEDTAGREALAAQKRVPPHRAPAGLEPAGPDRWVTPGLILGLLVLAALGDGLYRLLRRARILPLAEGAGLEGGGARARGERGAEDPRIERAGEDLRERIGWRALLALAAVPWVVILLDLLRTPIGRWSFVAVAGLVLVAGALVDRRRLGRPSAFSRPPARRALVPWGSIRRSPAAWLLGLAASSLVACSLVQVMILPERNYDALVGWDLVGRVLALEGRLRSSVFTRINFNAQAIYAPFACSNNGFGYLFHPAIHRLWVPLLAGAFLLVLHRRVQLWTGSVTAASLAAFVLFLPRAFLAQLTMAMTDLPSMAFTALALFAGVDLLRGRGGYGAPAALMLCAGTARTENLLPAIGLGALALLRGLPWPRLPGRADGAAVRRGGTDRPAARLGGSPLPHRLRALWIVALPAAFFAFWNLFYVKGQFGYNPAAHFRPLDLDVARMLEVLRRALEIVGMRSILGEFWVVAALAPALWALGRWPAMARLLGGSSGSDVAGTLLLVSTASFLCYLAFFYMWDPVLNPLWSMEHTFKRGFFRFMPGILAAFLALPAVARLLRRCEV